MAVLATPSAAVKRCVACGRDVAGTKRMKDSQGRYWCVDCGEADLKKKTKVASKSASSSGPGLFERIGSIRESGGGGGQTSKGRLIGMLLLAAVLAAVVGWQFLSRHS
jgi:predicted RNA-binding Zn-ribbon protein involved in translation (DUF1610 family)